MYAPASPRSIISTTLTDGLYAVDVMRRHVDVAAAAHACLLPQRFDAYAQRGGGRIAATAARHAAAAARIMQPVNGIFGTGVHRGRDFELVRGHGLGTARRLAFDQTPDASEDKLRYLKDRADQYLDTVQDTGIVGTTFAGFVMASSMVPLALGAAVGALIGCVLVGVRKLTGSPQAAGATIAYAARLGGTLGAGLNVLRWWPLFALLQIPRLATAALTALAVTLGAASGVVTEVVRSGLTRREAGHNDSPVFYSGLEAPTLPPPAWAAVV